MSVSSRSPAISLADRLDALAFGLMAIIPLAMAIQNRSAQPILIASAIVAVIARGSAGELGLVRERITATITRPIGLLCLAFLAFGLVSFAWSHFLKTSVAAFSEIVASSGAALILHAALPRRIPGWVPKLAGIAIALGCLSLISELATGMTLRNQLGIRSATFIFKRSVTAILIVGWPIAAYLWLTGKRPVAVALGLLFVMATYMAHSSATALGLATGLGLAAVMLWSRRAGSLLAAAMLASAMLIAPFLGDTAVRVLPKSLVEKMHFAHADDRISIWQSFGEVVKRRPIAGAGFGVSPRMADDPVAKEVPEDRRVLLGAWHPHNGYLQLWSETGVIGAALTGAAMVLLALGLGSLPVLQAVIGAAILGSVFAVMLVGHGIWQGWWAAVIGIAALVTARLPETLANRPPAPEPRPRRAP